MDPKRPGQILKPGVPSVSKGFTAPSPFSRGATSAFGPVLQAASNYLNEITRTARIQNRMVMSNMGGGGSAGSRSNIAVNGSVESRNTNRTISANPDSAPLNDYVNIINPDGTYQSFRSFPQAFANVTGQDRFEGDAALARQNLSATSPQAPPINDQNQMNDNQNQMDDDDSSVRVLAEENQQILDDNDKQNRNLNELIEQEIPMGDADNYLYMTWMRANEAAQQRLLERMREMGQLNAFEQGFNRFLNQ
jgi:hypothetical protein